MEGEPQIKIATGAREGEKQGKEERENQRQRKIAKNIQSQRNIETVKN